jgi:hypothetical protein
MKHQTYPEPAAAILAGTPDFERLPRDSYSTANLTTPRAGEVDDATEPGAKLKGRLNRLHILVLCNIEKVRGLVAKMERGNLSEIAAFRSSGSNA